MALVYPLPTTGRKIPLSCSRRVLANSFIVFLAPRKFITADFENAIAINCACLPTYGPILSRSVAAFSRSKARYHARRGELAWRIDSDHDTLAQDHETIRDLYSRPENPWKRFTKSTSPKSPAREVQWRLRKVMSLTQYKVPKSLRSYDPPLGFQSNEIWQ